MSLPGVEDLDPHIAYSEITRWPWIDCKDVERNNCCIFVRVKSILTTDVV